VQVSGGGRLQPAGITVMPMRQAIHSVRSYAVARQLQPALCARIVRERNWPRVP